MENILKDLLYITVKQGGKDIRHDVFEEFGVFLTEEREGEFSNYSELLTPPAMKPYTEVNFREENGVRLPDELPTPCYEARDVNLSFALIAESNADWVAKYSNFLTLLKSGWLQLEVPELGKTFRLYYKECSQYTQLTRIEVGVVAAKLKIRFREPNPEPGVSVPNK